MSISLETLALSKKYTDEHGGGGTGGTMNYTDLINKPRINGVELVGDKTTAELGIKDGQTPNITIGTVETLPAGSDVTASISGQTPNLVLNLGIPQGQNGDPGQAATVTVGTTTTGAPGSQASVVNSGTSNAAVLDFIIPAGQTGTGLPPTDTAQDGYVPTFRDGKIVWEAPSGGGDKPWALFQEITGDGETLYWEWTDLDFTEFLFVGVGLTNQSESTTSTVRISINAKEVAYLNTQKSVGASATKYQRLRLKYSGYFWDSVLISQSNNETSYYTTYGVANCPYSVELGAQKCSTLKLSTPASIHRLISGTIRIYAR